MATKKKTSSKKQTYNLQAALAGVPDTAREQDPGMPADTFIREARNCLKEGVKAQKKLTALPDFDGSVFASLPVLIPRFEAAQKKWEQERNRVAKGTGRVALRKEGEALRADMLASGGFLFRKMPEALAELDRIREGDGIDDLIVDLRDLVAFRQDNASRWAADVRLTEEDFERAGEIAEALEGQKDSEGALDARAERNQLAFLMSAALREIREGARYLFRAEPSRQLLFMSTFEASRRAASRKAAKKKGDKPA